MSSIITSILSSTVGLLYNKARHKTAAQLKDGDITDAKVREIVVRELDDIKTKLDGISRKDLLSNYSFLQEGVDLIIVSLDKSNNERKKAVLNEAQDSRGETSSMPSGVETGILNEALELSHAMGKLKINSDKEFESAKERFKDARKKATEAFCNEALSIQDRIFAAKLRIVSEILECLDNPETAITGCLSFLKKLHGLPAVREIFSVYINGGVKSLFNKAKRVGNVKSVMLINYVLFQFVFRLFDFSHKLSDRQSWPVIELTDRSFNPILNWQEISTRKSWGNELTQPPHELVLDEQLASYLSAVNSHGEIVVEYSSDAIMVISKTGESKVVELPDRREREVIRQSIVGLAVDNNENVYVVKWLKTSTENVDVESFVVYVLDENYNVKHDYRLDFFETTRCYSVKIAVNKNNDIIMIKRDDPHVYVCDNTGQLKHKFKRDSRWAGSLSISDKNEIMVPSDDNDTVHLYTEEGDVNSSIKLPEGHVVQGLAFHHVISKIIVLSHVREQRHSKSFFLLCYSETGELETSTFFCKADSISLWPDITSYPGGPVAVVTKEKITYI